MPDHLACNINNTFDTVTNGTGASTVTFTGTKSVELRGVIGTGGDTIGLVINNTTAATNDDNVVLTGANVFDGSVTITDGELFLNNADADGAGTVYNLNGGALNLYLNAAMAQNIVMAGNAEIITTTAQTMSGTIDCDGTRILTLSGAKSLILSGIIGTGGDNLSLVINNVTAADGDDNVTLSGANAFIGSITISDGELILTNNAAAEGTGAGGLALNGGTLTFDVAYDNNFGPAITMANSAIIKTSTAASVLNNTIDINTNTLTLNGNQNLTLSGAIGTAGDTGALTINMGALSQVVTLSGANTYTGLTTITQGTVLAKNNTALGTVAGGVTVAATNGRLQLSHATGITVGAEALTINGSVAGEFENVTGDNSWAGGVTLVNATNDILVTAGTLTISGVVTGAQPLEKTGTGKLVLSGANDYTGDTTVSAGTLNVQNAAGLGTTGGDTIVAAGASLELQGGAVVAVGEDLTLNGGGLSELKSVSGTNSWAGLVVLATAANDIEVAAGTLTISGVISGAQNLTKLGAAGTLKFTGANTYTGTTTVSAGTLLYNTAMDNTCNGAITVASGATLGGAAGTAKGNVSVSSGGIVNPGDGGVGTLTVAGTFTFVGASKLTVDILNATSDLLAVTGSLTVSGTSEIELGSVTGSQAIQYTVVTCASGGAPFQTTNLTSGWTQTTAATFIKLTGAVAAIPTLNEWGLIIMLILLAGTGVMLMRRRQRSASIA